MKLKHIPLNTTFKVMAALNLPVLVAVSACDSDGNLPSELNITISVPDADDGTVVSTDSPAV